MDIQTSPITVTAEDISLGESTSPIGKLLHFQGQLDESNVDAQAAVITDMVDTMDSGTFLILDFEHLDYLNSKSIGYVTYWHVKMQKKNSELIIVAVHDNIKDILAVVGLTQLVKSFETMAEVQQYLASLAKQ